MGNFFDKLETRSADQRAADLATALPRQVANTIQNASGYGALLKDLNPEDITNLDALASLPVCLLASAVFALLIKETACRIKSI